MHPDFATIGSFVAASICSAFLCGCCQIAMRPKRRYWLLASAMVFLLAMACGGRAGFILSAAALVALVVAVLDISLIVARGLKKETNLLVGDDVIRYAGQEPQRQTAFCNWPEAIHSAETHLRFLALSGDPAAQLIVKGGPAQLYDAAMGLVMQDALAFYELAAGKPYALPSPTLTMVGVAGEPTQ